MSTLTVEDAGLTAEQEVALAKRIEVGVYAQRLLAAGTGRAWLPQLVDDGQVALEEFYLANLPLVRAIASDWGRRTGLPFAELFQEGCLGLGESIMRWDWSRGLRFSTLAFKLVSFQVATAAALRCGVLDASVARARAAMAQRRQQNMLEAHLGRQLSLTDFARLTGQNPQAVAELANLGRSQTLREDVAYETRDDDDRLPPNWADVLTAREQVVVTLRYLAEPNTATLAQVAGKLGVSAATARRIEERALRKLRQHLSCVA